MRSIDPLIITKKRFIAEFETLILNKQNFVSLQDIHKMARKKNIVENIVFTLTLKSKRKITK